MGQGLAGTLLAHQLIAHGYKVLIIDNHREPTLMGSSSKIAAGVINPITGRRIVKSWRIDALLPSAKKMYQDIERQYDIDIYKHYTILRTFKNAHDENEWHLRSQWVEYQPFCCPEADPSVFGGKIRDFYGFGEISQAAKVDMPVLIQFFRKKWLSEGVLLESVFDHNALIMAQNNVVYKNIIAQKIIFCEGANGSKNIFFNWLPFNLDKGELLIVKIPNVNFDKIFKNNISIVPLKEKDHYWVGATNEWNSENDLPSEDKKALIINELREILSIPFEVIKHQAAFRPTVKDRRPLIGFHPRFPQLAFFNGFGTKGASLVPYWANHLVAVLKGEIDIDKEVNINRFG